MAYAVSIMPRELFPIAPIEKLFDVSFYLAMPQKGNFVTFTKHVYQMGRPKVKNVRSSL